MKMELVRFLFLVIGLLSLLFFYLAAPKDRRPITCFTIWALAIGLPGYFGWFEDTAATPPRFPIVLIGGITISIWSYHWLKQKRINHRWLLAIHSLRIPIEMMLFQLFLKGLIPELMTFHGYNLDILVGISALMLLIYSGFSRRPPGQIYFLLWNILGLMFLTMIVVLAILSSPLPIQLLAFDQPNTGLLKFPFLFLPAVIVPLVYLAHILAIKNWKNLDCSF